jgi:hypothetical protein
MQHPGGLANSSGVVGRYLHDSTGSSAGGFLPQLMDRKRYNEDGVGSVHIYSPWWLDNKKLDFPRGYHIEYGGGMHMPSYGFGGGIQNMNGAVPGRDGKMKEAGGYGASLKDDYRRFLVPSLVWPVVVLLLPVTITIARLTLMWLINTGSRYCVSTINGHDDEIKQAKHMQETFQEIMHNMAWVLFMAVRKALKPIMV